MDPKVFKPYEIATIPLAELTENPDNPRTISDAALKGLSASIERFGLIQPIIWNRQTGHIVGGHQRKKALEAAGYTEVQVLVVDFAPDEEMMANVSLNNRHLQGQFTDEAADLLVRFEDFAPDASRDLRFDDLLGDLADRVKKPGQTAEDDLPAGPEPRTKRGDLWMLGDHRLICGSSTEIERTLWQTLFGGNPKASLIFTDPPYGVSYKGEGFARIKNDEKTGDELIRALLVPAFMNAKDYASDNAAWYIWHASSTREDFAWAMKAAGLEERQYLIWAKPQPVLGWADYGWAHEPCFYACKAGGSPAFYGDRGQATVWRAMLVQTHNKAATVEPGIILRDGAGNEVYIAARAPKGKKTRSVRLEHGQSIGLFIGDGKADLWEVSRDAGADHPTQKPVELARRAIENSSRPGEIVLDMFLGSGATLIAAESTGRACFGFELEPAYCDVVLKRWEAFTGKTAQRLPTSV